MSTPGKTDKEIKGWIDGKLACRVKNTTTRDGDAANVTWRRSWVGS